MDDKTDRKLYTDAEVYRMLGFSRSTWAVMKKAGETPKPKKIPGHADFYTIEAIDAWRNK